jgi:heme exporter protein B
VLGDVRAVGSKELRLLLRGRSGAGSVLAFGALLLLVLAFAFGPSQHPRLFAPGALWVSFFFTGSLAVAPTFALERENDAWEGFLLTPADRLALFWGKMASSGVLLACVEAVGIPAYLLFFHGLGTVAWGLLTASCLLTDVGFLAAALLLAAAAAHVRAGEVLYPLLLFPIAVPLLLAAVRTTRAALGGGAAGAWWGLLGGYDAVFLALAMVLFDDVVEVM